ncbi:MAG: hypothetical protein N3F05_01950 [Candidatus Diapherotrites archaeon]|nr:hypothetical protein [Candidatus Diapherotrites archaeon]
MLYIATGSADFFRDTVTKIFDEIYRALPGLLGFIILSFVGYIIGLILKKLLLRATAHMRIEEWLEEQSLLQVVTAKTLTSILGNILHWSIILLFMAQGAELMRYEVLRNALHWIIYFILLVLLAIVILLSGLVIGRYIKNTIENSVEKIGKIIGLIAEAFVVFISAIMALEVIPGVNTAVLHYAFIIVFGSIAIAIAIAIGIGFGLALKDEAKEIIEELKKPNNIKRKKSAKGE